LSLFNGETAKTTSEMASMAKPAPKTLVSYAGVVKGKGVKTSFFATTVCDIKVPRNVPNKRIPNTNEKHSFFVDLLNINATEEEIAKAITLEGILGVKYRADLTVVEFICADENVQKKALGMEFEVKGKAKFVAIAPRHLLQRTILVKIANMDFGVEAELKESLVKYWSQYGEVVDAAPHKHPGKTWLTQRWDILLTIPEAEKKLRAPVIFKLAESERSLLATWSGAAKSCIKCLAAGHATSNCRGKNPKLGERPNPEKKDLQRAQAEKGKGKVDPEKTPQMGLDNVPLPKSKETVPTVTETVPESATASVSVTASASVSATVSETVSESVEKSGDSGVEGPELSAEEEEIKPEEDRGDFGPFIRKGTKPSWLRQGAWDKYIAEISPETWERINAEPPPKVRIRDGIVIVENQRETVTPPPFQLEDPDTPRKGNKRMVKEDKAEAEGFKKFAAEEKVEVRRSGRTRLAKKR
jgi:hypothetical protein